MSRLSLPPAGRFTEPSPSRRRLLTLAPLAAVAVAAAACTSSATDSGNTATGTEASASASSAGTAAVAALAFPLIATGQSSCYDDAGEEITCPLEGESFYGQDANFAEGEPMSYTDNGDGTITDGHTGLTWQQVPSDASFTWQEAVDYVDGLELGGHDDWRLPSAKELWSIADFSSSWPYLDTDYFSLASGEVTKDEQYWTSTTYVGTTVEGGDDAVFGVNAVTGHIKAYAAEASGPIGGNYVRAVRGTAYGENAFADNGDGTVTDEATGLMWAQSDDGVELDWEDALAYADDSDLGGHSDWRLPNVKELQSIDAVFTSTQMTNGAGDSDYGYYWSSTSAPIHRRRALLLRLVRDAG